MLPPLQSQDHRRWHEQRGPGLPLSLVSGGEYARDRVRGHDHDVPHESRDLDRVPRELA